MLTQPEVRSVRGAAVGAGILAGVAVLGLVCVVGPALASGAKPMQAPLFPMLRAAIEGLDSMALILLGVLGIACGLLTKIGTLKVGLASVSLLPLAAIAEIVVDRTSHNLIPFELAMYALLAGPAAIGTLAGRGLRRMLSRPEQPVGGAVS